MKKALLIGINDYPKGNELKGCIEDINLVKAAIERNGDNTTNFDVKMMTNVKTSNDAMNAISKLFEGEGDISLLYFSGHGYVNNTGAEIVMPKDIEDNTQYYKGIQMSTIMKIVNNSHVRNKIIILDCCHSGNMGKYDLEDSGSILNTGVSILAACREDEVALERGGHGIFTELLCSALNGGAADYCGNITIGGVYAYIDRSLGPWDQRPIFKTNITEFVSLRKVEPQVELSNIRELTNLFNNSNDIFQLDPSFEYTNDPSIEHKYIPAYANSENIRKFKLLQKLQSIGFVKPIDAEYMYFAAMNSTGCKLTELGKYYWNLVNKRRI